MPYGPRNSFSSRRYERTRSSFFLFRTERRRRPPYPTNPSSVGATCATTSGWRLLKSAISSRSFGKRSRRSPGKTVAAQREEESHHRPHLQPHRTPVGEPQEVVEEPVDIVPHLVVMLAEAIHRVRDPDEVLEEPVSVLLVHRVLLGEDERDLEHVLAVEGHPGRSVRLLERAPGRKRRASVEDADVVEAEEAAREDVPSGGVLPVHPPVEVEEQPLEGALEELDVAPPEVPLDLVEEVRRPGVDRRVHVAEVPLVRGDLPVRMGIEALEHQEELLLGEVEVDERERDRVEREVPRRVPRVLPLVRHRNDVAVEHVEPLGVPGSRLLPEERVRVVLAEPPVDVEEVELLRPEHSRERLPVDPALVLAQRAGGDLVVEIVGVGEARGDGRVEPPAERRCRRRGSEAQPHDLAPPAGTSRRTGPRPSCRSSRG